MVWIELTEEQLEDLKAGSAVEVIHPDLGPDGRNGSLVIHPPGISQGEVG